MNSNPGKICFYIVVSDIGLAPNPFHGFCTLALCTPNHMKARLEKGDWIVGCFRCDQLPKIVYIMQVDESMLLNDYYNDPRFACKTVSNHNWKTEVGDNIYYVDNRGNLLQDTNTSYHNDENEQNKDKYGNRVFIGKQFVYFGKKAIDFPSAEFYNCLPRTKGIKYLRNTDPLYQDFLKWSKALGSGVKGNPRDNRKINTASECIGNCK